MTASETASKASNDVTQDFGDDPHKVRESDHYTAEYVGGFVDKWDDLIDWERRSESEGDFFIRSLQRYGCKKILDVATGTGFHSIRLLNAGFEVVSADGSAEMLDRAFQNGRKHGHILRTVQADWRWLNRDVHGEYDAIICLGNSFTHLFEEHDRRKALAEFYAMLKHDGILILDQRNYDRILDQGFSTKHAYYYCGEDVKAEPAHVDDGLARFRYTFPDKSEYYLNMFPLRKNYTRRLMHEVGFQRVGTYGDFHETYREDEPDFYVHVAEKLYIPEDEPEDDTSTRVARVGYSSTVETARSYYNSDDADRFYYHVWGGEDIHVGLYESDDESIRDASRRTVEVMAAKLNLKPGMRVIDLGAGYGGAARYLAKHFGVRVVALNLSEAENDRNRQMNLQAKLHHLIDVVDGSFEEVPFKSATFDAVWSQDAVLHSGDRSGVMEEIVRVLKPGGEVIMTDPMQADDCPEGVLEPILARIHLESLGSPGFYQSEWNRLTGTEMTFEDHTPMLARHYARVLAETQRHEKDLQGKVSTAYLERMKQGLAHWVEGGKNGHLAWGMLYAQMP